MSVLPQMPESLKVKSFWDKPEGTTGMIALGFLGLVGFWWLPTILTGLLSILTLGTSIIGQGITLTLLGFVLVGLILVLTDKGFQTLCKYMFKSSMRAVTGVFVETDPIGIMRGYISDLKDKKNIFSEQKSGLNGQIAACQEAIMNNQSQISESMGMMKAAKEQGRVSLLSSHSKTIGRLQDFNKRLEVTLNKMGLLYKALDKYYDASDSVIQDLTSEVTIREKERKLMLSSYGAMKTAMSILSGGGSDRELFDQAMEYVVEDYGKKLGEIEDFMNESKNIIAGIDVKNGMWEERALKQLEAWEAKSDSIVLGENKRLMLEDNSSNLIELKPSMSYDHYFEPAKRS